MAIYNYSNALLLFVLFVYIVLQSSSSIRFLSVFGHLITCFDSIHIFCFLSFLVCFISSLFLPISFFHHSFFFLLLPFFLPLFLSFCSFLSFSSFPYSFFSLFGSTFFFLSFIHSNCLSFFRIFYHLFLDFLLSFLWGVFRV